MIASGVAIPVVLASEDEVRATLLGQLVDGMLEAAGADDDAAAQIRARLKECGVILGN